MIKLRRPAPPTGFATAAKAALAAVQAIMDAGVELASDDFPSVWDDYKAHFLTAQHNKCAYCERYITSTGDVDHYRPKAEVGDLQSPGDELPGLLNVTGRSIPTKYKPGYWWLAYDWKNWLVACERCNRVWKRTLFPVAEKPRPQPKQGVTETPLLLNPFGKHKPSKHFKYDRLGQVTSRASPHGKATIETCGLDRESLRATRYQIARQAYGLVARFQKAINEKRAADASISATDLIHLGDAASLHAGVVRSIVEVECGVTWVAFSKLMI